MGRILDALRAQNIIGHPEDSGKLKRVSKINLRLDQNSPLQPRKGKRTLRVEMVGRMRPPVESGKLKRLSEIKLRLDHNSPVRPRKKGIPSKVNCRPQV